jgi:hypothetical protein
MPAVSIAYAIHQAFGFSCSLATLAILGNQWYGIWKDKKAGPNRSRYAVVRVQVAGAGGNGSVGGGATGNPYANTNATTGGNGTRVGSDPNAAAAAGNNTNNNTTMGNDTAIVEDKVGSTNGNNNMTRGGQQAMLIDNREPDVRPSNNDGNTHILIRRWCAVAAVIQIFAFVDPMGVRGIYPLCAWRFLHNTITSDIHCLGLGIYFITSQVIYRLLNTKPHILLVITLLTLATGTVLVGWTSPLMTCWINEEWAHAINLWWYVPPRLPLSYHYLSRAIF